MQKEINERSICVKELTKINIDIYLEESIQNLKNFIISEEDEFNIDGYRFIHKNKIDEIMQKEMEENGNMAIDVPKEVLKKYLDIPNHILDIMLKKIMMKLFTNLRYIIQTNFKKNAYLKDGKNGMDIRHILDQLIFLKQNY